MTNENDFTNKGHKEKDRLKKATKIKISLERNLVSRPNKIKIHPKQ